MPGWMKHKLESRLPGSITSYMQMTPPLWQKVKRVLKSLLMKVKDESEKGGLKLNIQTTKIRASGTFTSWQIDGETVEIVADFILGGSKITADGDCSHEIKRCLLLGRKVMTNLDSILKSRNVTLPTNVCLVNAMVFPVVMYGCESWTRLSDFTFTFHFHVLKEMAAHSSVLAWRIPGTGEPGGLPSMGSHRVGHD